MNVKDKLLLTVADFAEVAQVSLPVAYRIIHSGNGPDFIRVGRAIRIPTEAVEEWITANRGGNQVLG